MSAIPVNGRPSTWIKVKYGLIRKVGRLLYRFSAPGLVQSLDFHDQVTGSHIRIHPGMGFTIISVNNRDYWFSRLTGKFDGAGTNFDNGGSLP